MGNIYTRQRCWLCGGKLIHDRNRNGCFCKEHPQVRADRDFVVKFGRLVQKRFKTYEAAAAYLNGLRYETDMKRFDARDHAAGQPLGFRNLAKEYLEWKRKKNLASIDHIVRYIETAIEYFGNRNVKHLKKKDFEEFLYSLEVSDNTRHKYLTQIKDFYTNFLYEYEEVLKLPDLPKFPKWEFQIGFRKVATIADREKVMDRVYELTYSRNPKLWLLLDMACCYSKLRPIDLRNLKEGDLDVKEGILTVERPSKSKKRSKPYVIRIRMLDYHIGEVKRLKQEYPALPETPFFRHPRGIKGVVPGTPISAGRYYKVWKMACKDVGIEGLDMYGGTRHTTITAIAKELGAKDARRHSGHRTNAAFDRYCQADELQDLEMSESVAKIRGKVINIKERKNVNSS